MKPLTIVKTILFACLFVNILFAQPPENELMRDPGPDDLIHSDMPPPPPQKHEGSMAFRPAGIVPDPFLLRDPVKLKNLLSDLGVNDRPKQQILALVRDFNKEMEGRILRIHQEELNIRGELLKDNPDLAIIQKTIYKKAQIFAEIEFSQVKRDVGIKNLLTEDEFEMWKSKIREQMLQVQKLRDGDKSKAREEVK
jgi:hypothetical protein